MQREVLESLLGCSISHFSKLKADNITVWLPEHPALVGQFRKMGFLARETPHDLIVRSHGKRENDYLADISRWFFTMGDSDNY